MKTAEKNANFVGFYSRGGRPGTGIRTIAVVSDRNGRRYNSTSGIKNLDGEEITAGYFLVSKSILRDDRKRSNLIHRFNRACHHELGCRRIRHCRRDVDEIR